MRPVPVIVVQLVHILGPMKGEIQEFSRAPVLIGRDPSCDLRFPADITTISRKHAEIRREGNQFRLIDTSTNGTLVNGKRTKDTYLKNGDVIEFSEGGPKVSFLSEMKEGQVEPEVVPPAPPAKPREQPQARPVQEPLQVARQPERPQPVQQEIVQPRYEPPVEVPVQKVSAPLIIQYGPTLRSYRDLPVTIGKRPGCDFVLDHPAVYEQHAQIFFGQDMYWIKDLTGQQQVRINGQPVSAQSPLRVNDEISMGPSGPVFRFLGEGRLAEVETAPVQEPSPSAEEKKPAPSEVHEEKLSNKLLYKVKKYIDRKLQ
jgi:pSer/pThr/pTyr-binding forkhead associated (FHA) protein